MGFLEKSLRRSSTGNLVPRNLPHRWPALQSKRKWTFIRAISSNLLPLPSFTLVLSPLLSISFHCGKHPGLGVLSPSRTIFLKRRMFSQVGGTSLSVFRATVLLSPGLEPFESLQDGHEGCDWHRSVFLTTFFVFGAPALLLAAPDGATITGKVVLKGIPLEVRTRSI